MRKRQRNQMAGPFSFRCNRPEAVCGSQLQVRRQLSTHMRDAPVGQTTDDATRRLFHGVAMDARVVPITATGFLVRTDQNGVPVAVWGIIRALIPATQQNQFGQP